ncbi:hypothetical protein K432DRAFT_293127 [Lepidopterella palustris CBS 459.81]|uniref:non-specific serine/threonine protein kinase n=1 Tax=Lepidopterella palustris CBS 459.81 TaxID=1314670 RepID=A0A8E2JH58_9PEZI|nr:hypothetical protein K432DRAFT_293127 [Lepidopterella palustris CBS 459.81]
MAKERKGEPPEVLRTCSQDTPREETDEFSAHVRPLLKLCSDPVSRYAPVPFATWSARLESHFSIAKIAEASYGEVYRLSLKSSIPGFTKADESVLKIIALEPPKPTPGVSSRTHTPKQSRASAKKTSWMSAIPSVESEVKLLQRMTPVPGFTNFRDVRVLQGRPAPAFVAAWKAFNKGRKKGEKSIFPDPSRKASYAETQLWAVVEMQDAGTDLENVVVRDVWSVWDVFWGVALAVGKGEEGMRFEHRDLHLGNICIRPPSPTTSVTSPTIRITNRNLNFTGLETTIIDYTLSRAGMSDPSPSSPQPDTEIAYLDLDRDLSLFTADATHEYQYEVYRYMRNCVLYSTPLAACNHAVPAPCDWKGFHPLTNLIWLHFLLHKLLQNMDWPSAGLDLSRLAPSEDAKLARRKARRLERALVRLRGMLEPEALGRENEGLESVRELVAVALGEGWLEEGDVVGIWREEVEG